MFHSYDLAFQNELNKLHDNLADNLQILPSLSKQISSKALKFLLELACQCQSSRNIQLGRDGLKSIPRSWLPSNIDREAQLLLNMDDEWEYRRLAEIYFELDLDMAKNLAQLGLESKNEEVVEAAEDLVDWITEFGEANE